MLQKRSVIASTEQHSSLQNCLLPMAVLLLLIAPLLGRILPAYSADTLVLGDLLTPSSPPLTSAKGSFTLSFRPFAASNSSLLYLVIAFSSSPHSHPAWVANRNQPVSSSASLKLSDGSLTLVDSSAVVWSTPPLGVVTSQLLDSGNLVLYNRSSVAVWQSFDYPTDTLLPGQQFGLGQNLTSQRRSDSFKSGSFTFQFDDSGVASLSDSQTDPDDTSNFAANYWSWGEPVANASVAQLTYLKYDLYGNLSLYQSGVLNSTCTASDYGSQKIRRLTLDLDGNLRMYSWDTASSRWIRVWLAVENLCQGLRSLCGQYGICILDPEPVCICPPGFQPRDLADISQGCSPTSPVDYCSTTEYVELDGTDFPYHDYTDFTGSSEANCKLQCSSNCGCLAAVFWQTSTLSGHCWLKSQLLNGFSLQSQRVRSFLKISGVDKLALTSVLDNGTHWSSDTVWQGAAAPAIIVNDTNFGQVHDSRKAVIVVLATVIAAQLVGFTALLACLNRRTARRLEYAKLHGDLEGVSGSPIMLSYQELEDATDQFSHLLGSGGFGKVYKGRLRNGKAVAVKRLEGLSHRESQFRAEIATIGKVHHINLLRLSGFCADGEHRLLVYEYMENGSLDAVLFRPSKDTVLDWKTRHQICLGVARGITYLHEECLDCILHCDIKPQNILLDKNNRAKVADFGLAYLFSRDHTMKVSSIRGTRGYLAPEWLSNRPITAKADVFSYGMLLFEIVSGRSNYVLTSSAMNEEENERWCFPVWAYTRAVEEVVDEKLGADVDYNEAAAVLKVAFLCIQGDVNARPSMGKVVQMLEGTLPIAEAPRPPLLDGAYDYQPSMKQSRHALSFQPSTPSSSTHSACGE